MARYILFHTIACLTRQQLKRLAENLESHPEVRLLRLSASTLAGRLTAEFEAPDKEALVAWLDGQNLKADEMFRVEYDWAEGTLNRV